MAHHVPGQNPSPKTVHENGAASRITGMRSWISATRSLAAIVRTANVLTPLVRARVLPVLPRPARPNAGPHGQPGERLALGVDRRRLGLRLGPVGDEAPAQQVERALAGVVVLADGPKCPLSR